MGFEYIETDMTVTNIFYSLSLNLFPYHFFFIQSTMWIVCLVVWGKIVSPFVHAKVNK